MKKFSEGWCGRVGAGKRTFAKTGRLVDVLKDPRDYLHELIIFWTDEKPEANCRCRQRIETMNVWGPQGCRDHIDEIVG